MTTGRCGRQLLRKRISSSRGDCDGMLDGIDRCRGTVARRHATGVAVSGIVSRSMKSVLIVVRIFVRDNWLRGWDENRIPAGLGQVHDPLRQRRGLPPCPLEPRQRAVDGLKATAESLYSLACRLRAAQLLRRPRHLI